MQCHMQCLEKDKTQNITQVKKNFKFEREILMYHMFLGL